MICESVNSTILDFYNQAECSSPGFFASHALSLARKHVAFDSAAHVTFSILHDGSAAVTGLGAINLHPDKARLRRELVGQEGYDKQRGFYSSDSAFVEVFNNPGKTFFYDVNDLSDKRMLEYAVRTEVQYSLTQTSHALSQRQVISVNYWRAQKKAKYTAADQHTASLITPHLMRAISINRKLTESVLIGNLKTNGLIVSEYNGHMHHIDDLSLMVLRREFPHWLSHQLPSQVVEALQGTGCFNGKHAQLSARHQGSVMLITVKARQVGQTLTPAELRAVELTVQFGNHKKVAQILDISPATVRNHLNAAYKKLGIHDRTELIKAFDYLK